ncbi:sensor histidine kinase [Micromonospora lutea]|uniref:histidine kinase n=1 Tax=Micromonospora lutea TaxID=419825 RepID=A0ABQ4IWI3_9ACTN|nr:histidine kinase [Micromonospora lutea]GIJ22276.1 ATPase [Micromonospora lutea]
MRQGHDGFPDDLVEGGPQHPSPAGGWWSTAYERMRRFSGRRPWLLDGALAAATGAVSLGIGVGDSTGLYRDFDGPAWALTCLATLTLVGRRRAPVTVLLLFCAIWAGYITLGYHPVVNSSGALLALYTVAAARPAGPTVASASVPALVWLYGGLLDRQGSLLAALTQSLVWPAVVCYLGSAARRLNERGQQLAALTEELRRDRQELARRAVSDERLRIARDLHDVVAHHLSVVSVQAGLAWYVLSTDPPAARSALRTVRDTVGEALTEMRGMLGVLRPGQPEITDSPTPEQPAPGLARVDDLLSRIRAAGVPVRTVVTGVPRDLPPGPDLCAFRFLQEALTNVLNHSGGATTVTLDHQPDQFVATVADEGPRHRSRRLPRPAGTGGGRGLIGMVERARQYGGTVRVEQDEHGFTVRLTLPTSPPPPSPESHAARR